MSPSQVDQLAKNTTQVWIGAGKTLVNTVTSTVNITLNVATNGGNYIPGSTPEIPQLKPSNEGQAAGMLTMNVSLVGTGLISGGMAIVDLTSQVRMASVIQEQLGSAIANRAGNPGAMIGAYDTTTGATTVGTSGPISRLGPINDQIAAAANRAGGIGAVNPDATAPVGCCAEVDAANKLTNAGSDLGNIRFTDAVRPASGNVVPKCANCEKMFPNQ
jgi:hypothetical protein